MHVCVPRRGNEALSQPSTQCQAAPSSALATSCLGRPNRTLRGWCAGEGGGGGEGGRGLVAERCRTAETIARLGWKEADNGGRGWGKGKGGAAAPPLMCPGCLGRSARRRRASRRVAADPQAGRRRGRTTQEGSELIRGAEDRLPLPRARLQDDATVGGLVGLWPSLSRTARPGGRGIPGCLTLSPAPGVGQPRAALAGRLRGRGALLHATLPPYPSLRLPCPAPRSCVATL